MKLLTALRRPVAHWQLYSLMQDGHIKLMPASKFFSKIPDSVVDCVVLDPPARYGCAMRHIERDIDDDDGGGSSGEGSKEELSTTVDDMLRALNALALCCARVLKPGGTTIFLSTPHMASAWEFAAESANLQLQNEIVVLWKSKKSKTDRRPVNEQPSLASVVRWHTKPGLRFAPTHDIVLKSNVITVERVPEDVRVNHSQRPVSLFTYLISSLTRPHDLVIDPFCGSGSSLVASMIARRQCVGAEIDPAQVTHARARVKMLEDHEEFENRPLEWAEGREQLCWWVNGKEIEVEG